VRASVSLLKLPALALVLSLLGHSTLLWRERPPAAASAVQTPRAVSIRLQAPPVPAPNQPDATAPPPRAAGGGRAPSALAQAAPAPARAAVSSEAPAPQFAPLRLSGPAQWRYRLRQGGQDGEASLSWQPEADGRYALRLSRRIGERSLPDLQSLGRLGPAGLAPERFALQRRGRDQQAVNFDQDEARLSFSASPAQYALPEGAQDRLSWWLQLAALVQAESAPLPGTRWRVWVAGLRGELREWTFELEAPTDPAQPGLHLRRLPLGPEDPGVQIWLDPARGHWPLRLRQGDPERRGFEIVLDEPPGP
jgi:hypothetical protein